MTEDAPREPVDLEAIEARVNAATPGPWQPIILDTGDTPNPRVAALNYVDRCISKGGEDFYIVLAEKADGPADVCHPGNGPSSEANAQFIAHARTDVPALLSEVRALREALANARSYIPRGPRVDESDLLADIDALLGERV